MKYIFLLLTIVCCVWAEGITNEISADEPCESNEVRPRCQQKDYRAYVRCIKNRVKRQACPFAQAQNVPEISVQTLPQVLQPQYDISHQYVLPQQPSQCQLQYSTCLNNCPTPSCQAQCPYNCGGSNAGSTTHYYVNPGPSTHFNDKTGSLTHVNSATGHNITTVIKLTNLVNNTNIVNVPTSINSTNINNINLNGTSGHWGLGSNKDGSCCIAVQPRSCGGTSCRHARRRVCGSQCTSKVIHVQNHSRCHGSRCGNRMVYVPQPRPSCSYSRAWPYVTCGERVKAERSCNGCYDHYGFGHHSFYSGRSAPDCDGCYDDGYDQGPLYRHGPFFQPGFYHQPPMFPFACGPFGCFGNQFVNPFGFPNYDNRYERRDNFDYDGDRYEDSNESVQYIDEDEFYESINKTYGGRNCTIKSNTTGESIPCGSVSSTNPYIKNQLSQPAIPLQQAPDQEAEIETSEKVDEAFESERAEQDLPSRSPYAHGWSGYHHRRRLPHRNHERPHPPRKHLKPWEPVSKDYNSYSE